MERDLAENFGGAGKRNESVEQSRSVTNQRNAQPDQGHHSFLFEVLPQAGSRLPHPRLGDYSVPGGRREAKRRLSQGFVIWVTRGLQPRAGLPARPAEPP
jgi:hypothetical protein